ncbi:hypothetical protein BDQ12DRAFT_627018 [Crucibulum laeve]|uniref:F-box domain-containing protein n=1 Tax=Crucibulum laeve TaxID=68775 RepID=A0A5C3M790_9AGAR|nr:hypothetical protein BDQ12DRAFT_627018 [Crucibulum laeve]
MNITALPMDILILILDKLSVLELAALSQACHTFNTLVMEFGWPAYLRAHPRPSYSLSRARTQWKPQYTFHYDRMSDDAWKRSEFIARPLSRAWFGKLQPILAISTSRLIVAAGSNLYSYKFGGSIDLASPSVEVEGMISLSENHQANCDITGITFVEDGGLDQTIYVGFQDGVLERVVLKPSSNEDELSADRANIATMHSGHFVESLSSDSNLLLSLSAEGQATLLDHHQYIPQSISTIELNTRSWTSHLSLHASGPYAAFGTSSSTPLVIHPITNDQLSPNPIAVLGTMSNQTTEPAVYGLSQAPICSPWGSSPQILVSGGFYGEIRCYDLRSSLRVSEAEGTSESSPAPLRPVLTLSNPWLDEAVYSVSCGGGSGSHIAAGSARHSVVSFWDVRSPKTGWSVHAPGNDRSPVYSVILESSRFFGATQSRPFVYDFGPGVTPDTYPAVPTNHDGLEQKMWSNLSYYVTKYPHNRGTPGNEH